MLTHARNPDALHRALPPTAQEGINDLNARLSTAERVPALPLPALSPRVLAPAASPPDALAPPASPPRHGPASLVEIATEVALLNALSEVLVRHHEAAQDRATAAAARLERAEAAVAHASRSAAAPSDSRALVVSAVQPTHPLEDRTVRALGAPPSHTAAPCTPPSAR